MTTHPYLLVDVFTDRPLTGNQLAVFTAAERLDEAHLQALAKELNLSETAFIFPPQAGGTARVRYFSSAFELPFAGHPTLGTASVLATELPEGTSAKMRLETKRGVVPVSVRREAHAFAGWMDQPIPTVEAWDKTDELIAALEVGAPILPVELYDNGVPHLYVVLDSVDEVAAITPNIPALLRVTGGARVNVLAGQGTNYVSRMFSPVDPAMPEDPACGSAAGPLTLHLVRHGVASSGDEIVISQGQFIGRPSTLRAIAEVRDGEIRRVQTGGSSVIVGRGEFHLP